MSITWTTEQEAKEAAAKGLIPAIEHCIKHHRQNRDCEYEELIGVLGDGSRISTGDCALCQKFECGSGCSNCPLGPVNCCPEYRPEWRAWETFMNDHSLANYQAFTKAAGVMVERLEMELAKAKEEVCAKAKAGQCITCKHKGSKICDSLHINCSGWEPKEAECAKNKPEFRHLDYGYDEDGDPCLMASEQDIGNFRTIGKNAIAPVGASYKVKTKLGNLLDDLARNAEDLEEFEIEAEDVCEAEGKITKDNQISFCWYPHDDIKTIAMATEIHQNLGQLIATAKRKQDVK